MAQFEGHRSWNAWNVSLWINNDEGLYNMAREYYADCRRKYHKETTARWFAAIRFVNDMAGCKTPDGGIYNRRCVFEAMEGIGD